MKRALAAAAILLALAAPRAQARTLWESNGRSLELTGSLRQLVIGTHGTNVDDFQDAAAADAGNCLLAENFLGCTAFDVVNESPVVTSLTRLRVRFDLQLMPELSVVLAYDNELRAGTLDTFEAQLGDALATEQWLPFDWNIVDTDVFAWDMLLYRFYLDYDSEKVGITVGRQRVPWGVGRLWNPIDRFNAIPPLALEPDQNPGVDAVNLRWHFTGFTTLQAVYAASEDIENQSYAARLHGVLFDVDYSLVAGVWEKAFATGFDLAGNVGGAAARAEVMWTHSDRDIWPVGADAPRSLGNFWQVVVSADYLIDVGTGIYALVEHLYNGNALGFGSGLPGPLLPFFEETPVPPAPGIDPDLGPFVTFSSTARFGGSRVVTRSDNLTGFMLGYDLTPEVRAEFLTIYDWRGRSAAFFPTLRYNALDWLDFTVGAQLFTGQRESEFGDQPILGYAIAEVWF